MRAGVPRLWQDIRQRLWRRAREGELVHLWVLPGYRVFFGKRLFLQHVVQLLDVAMVCEGLHLGLME